jgi:rare lipoprotein A
MKSIRRLRVQSVAVLAIACTTGAATAMFSLGVQAASGAASGEGPALAASPPQTDGTRVHLDRSGRRQVGNASFYANRYSGRTMADGTPMQLYSNNAASLTLPLGTTAKVTNLETGKSAIVTIRDRGPYVKGRIVDLSPTTALKIGIDRKKGLAKVVVTPLSIPLPDGSMKWLASNGRDS